MERGFILLSLLIVFATNINDISGNLTHDRNNIYKCCPAGLYVGRKKVCKEYNETFNFSNVDVYNNDKLKKIGKSIEDVFTIVPGKFEMEDFTKDDSADVTLLNFNIFITESGVMVLESPNYFQRWRYIPVKDYCVDYRIMADRAKIKVRIWAIIPEDNNAESNIYLTAATLVSCFFLLLVLLVYFLLPELQNLCGMILMAYVASLFMAFLLLAIIQLKVHTEEVCVGLTMAIYFFFLATFCWMSVMSYDIWWTFRGYAKARPIHRRGERFKFLMYCLYAWGVPLAMTIFLGVINSVDMSNLPWFITPRLPEQGCFLEGGVKLLYLYMPMLILILCNWLFYLMTAFNIWRLSRGTAVLDSAAAGSPQAHRTHRHRFMVYLKLSIVMGLNWLLEIVSFVYPDFKMWFISDAYNILLGLAIFLIFVCKKKIFRKLCKRYIGMKKTRWHPSSKSYSSSTSDSNQETVTLQTKVSSNPRGMNNYPNA